MRVVAALALLCAWLLSGCGSAGSEQATQTFGRADERITVARGSSFDIVLDANSGVGDSWRITGPPDSAVVEGTGQDYRSDSDQPGSPGHARFVFRAAGAGTTTVTIFNCYRCGPDGKPAPENQHLAPTLTFTVTVTS